MEQIFDPKIVAALGPDVTLNWYNCYRAWFVGGRDLATKRRNGMPECPARAAGVGNPVEKGLIGLVLCIWSRPLWVVRLGTLRRRAC